MFRERLIILPVLGAGPVPALELRLLNYGVQEAPAVFSAAVTVVACQVIPEPTAKSLSTFVQLHMCVAGQVAHPQVLPYVIKGVVSAVWPACLTPVVTIQ